MFANIPNYKEFYNENDINKQAPPSHLNNDYFLYQLPTFFKPIKVLFFSNKIYLFLFKHARHKL